MKELAFAGCAALAGLRRSPDTTPTAILAYHSHSTASPWGVHIADFERQLRSLRTRFRIVPLRDLQALASAPDGPIACLTFDDGYRDNYEQALPLLERHGVKATFFLISSSIGGRLSSRYEVEPLMDAGQAKELASLGHEIGSHTMTHANLTKIPPDRARREIADSRRALEDLLSAPVTSFAYPFGRHDEAVTRMTEDAGYKLAVTTREARVPSSPDWFALPRVSVTRSVGTLQFRGKLSPALDVYEGLRGRR